MVHQKWSTLVRIQDNWTHTCCFLTTLHHQTAGDHPSTGKQSGLDAHVLNSPRILKSHIGTPWPEQAPQIHCFMVYNISSRSNISKLENLTLKKKFSGFSKKRKRKGDLARLSCPLSCTLWSSEPHWSHPPESQKRVKPQLQFVSESAPLFSFYLAFLYYLSTLSIIWICTLRPSRMYWKSPLRV